MNAQVWHEEALGEEEGKRKAIHEKLASIVVPRIDLENATLQVAMDRLSALIRENDRAQVPELKGVNILVEQGRNSKVQEKRIASLSLMNATALEVLQSFTDVDKSIEFSLTPLGVRVRGALPVGEVPMDSIRNQGASLGDVIKKFKIAGIGSQNPISIICIPESLKEERLPNFHMNKTTVYSCAKLVSLLLTNKKQRKVELIEVDKNIIAFKLAEEVSQKIEEKSVINEVKVFSFRESLRGKKVAEKKKILKKEASTLVELCRLVDKGSTAKATVHLASGSVVMIGTKEEIVIGEQYREGLKSK